MFIEESLWIKEKLAGMDLSGVKTALNVGSSTLEFRTVTQPHIYKNVLLPLEERGIRIFNMDAKQAEGVDIVCDICTMEKIEQEFGLVICTALLEHVADVKKATSNLLRLTREAGFLLVTAPFRYRYHEDPIDNMFRADNKQLESIFPSAKIIFSEMLLINGIRYYNNPVELFRRMILNKKWEISYLMVQK